MRYSERFERDYNWFLEHKDIFSFCGDENFLSKKGESLILPDENGKAAKECFYAFDSSGKILPCKEPELLKQILKAKASINLHIKMWAEGRAEGTLSGIEFKEEICKEFALLPWMVEAVDSLKVKLWSHVEELRRFFKNNNKEKLLEKFL